MKGLPCGRPGLPTYDCQFYERIIKGIRHQIDVPVYPSYPAFMTTGSDTSPVADVASRFAHIEALAARGLLEFSIIDPGSANFSQTKTTSTAKSAGT
jgi:hypothetical protein